LFIEKIKYFFIERTPAFFSAWRNIFLHKEMCFGRIGEG